MRYNEWLLTSWHCRNTLSSNTALSITPEGQYLAEREDAARSEIKRKGLYLAALKEVSMRK
jgi:hypothetical protein